MPEPVAKAITNPIGTAISSVVGAGASLFGASKQSDAAVEAARIQANAANQAAELQRKAAEQQLAFEQQQAAVAQTNYQGTQTYNRQNYATQQANLAPYRAYGQGAIAQLARPAGS